MTLNLLSPCSIVSYLKDCCENCFFKFCQKKLQKNFLLKLKKSSLKKKIFSLNSPEKFVKMFFGRFQKIDFVFGHFYHERLKKSFKETLLAKKFSLEKIIYSTPSEQTPFVF